MRNIRCANASQAQRGSEAARLGGGAYSTFSSFVQQPFSSASLSAIAPLWPMLLLMRLRAPRQSEDASQPGKAKAGAHSSVSSLGMFGSACAMAAAPASVKGLLDSDRYSRRGDFAASALARRDVPLGPSLLELRVNEEMRGQPRRAAAREVAPLSPILFSSRSREVRKAQ